MLEHSEIPRCEACIEKLTPVHRVFAERGVHKGIRGAFRLCTVPLLFAVRSARLAESRVGT